MHVQPPIIKHTPSVSTRSQSAHFYYAITIYEVLPLHFNICTVRNAKQSTRCYYVDTTYIRILLTFNVLEHNKLSVNNPSRSMKYCTMYTRLPVLLHKSTNCTCVFVRHKQYSFHKIVFYMKTDVTKYLNQLGKKNTVAYYCDSSYIF